MSEAARAQGDGASQTTPLIAELPSHDYSVSPAILCRQVYDCLAAQAHLPGVLVHEPGGPLLALLSRQRVLEIFSKPFRSEVYFGRPLRALLRAENAPQPLCVRAADTVSHGVDLALHRPAETQFSEPIAVVQPDGSYRVITMQSLLLALAAAYQEQYAALEHTKDSLVRSERLSSLGGLVAGVAHEINTPVGVSLSAATLLQERVAQFGALLDKGNIRRSDLSMFFNDCRESGDIMSRNLERAAELIRSFKRVAVDQASDQMRDFELAQTVREITLSLMPGFRHSNLSIHEECQAGPLCQGYPGAIAQVVTNLIQNAQMHAFDAGCAGVITVRAARVDRDRAIEIQVEDDGKGMDADTLDKIFEPFFTTRRNQGGTGLGLHIVHNLVTGPLQGRIAVTSAPGAGTRFTVVIPAILPLARAAE